MNAPIWRRLARPAHRTIALLGVPLAAAIASVPAVAQSAPRPTPPAHAGHAAPHDSSFAALQERGKGAMGVDQYRSAHRFDDLPDGGEIELRSTENDAVAARAIREHMATVARAFAAGDFTAPAFVHGRRAAREVPGAAAMAARRAKIRYEVRPVAGGAALRMTTRDPQAIRAVHEFLAFQRADHRAPGRALRTPAGGRHPHHTP